MFCASCRMFFLAHIHCHCSGYTKTSSQLGSECTSSPRSLWGINNYTLERSESSNASPEAEDGD